MNNFEDLLMDSGYDSTSFLAIIDLEGNVMGTSGASTNACLKGGMFLPHWSRKTKMPSGYFVTG